MLLKMSIVLVVIISAALFWEYSVASEEIAYSVIKSDENIELRQYQPANAAQITMAGTRKEAANKAFMPLFNYIQGNNIASEKIPMTTPVSQAATKAASQKIPMTTPVSSQQTGEGEWVVSFYMPNEMSVNEVPTPKDERITIKHIPEKAMAAIQFSGRPSHDELEEYADKLRQYLEANAINYNNDPLFAFYNSPQTPDFMRRNEVLFEIDKIVHK